MGRDRRIWLWPSTACLLQALTTSAPAPRLFPHLHPSICRTRQASVELRGGTSLALSAAYHLAFVRNVYNPLEAGNVVGLVNYFDLGLELVAPLRPGPLPSGPASSWMCVAASWQVNRGLSVRARCDAAGAGLAAIVRGWWLPSTSLAVTLRQEWARVGRAAPSIGLSATLEK